MNHDLIHYSLLFSPDYSLFVSNFSLIFITHFLVLYQFSCSNSLSVNYITKETKKLLALSQRKRIALKKRGRNFEMKQYMEYILTGNFLQFYTVSLVIKSLHHQYTFNLIFSKYPSVFSTHNNININNNNNNANIYTG